MDVLLTVVVSLGFAVLAFGGLAFITFAHLHTREPDLDEGFCREVPTDLHPALLCELWQRRHGDRAFAATLMRLVAKGDVDVVGWGTVAPLDGCPADGQALGPAFYDYDIVLTCDDARRAAVTNDVDRSVLRFLFDYVQAQSHELGDERKRPEGTVRLSDLELVAREWPSSYFSKCRGWRTVVRYDLEHDFPGNDDFGLKILAVAHTLLCGAVIIALGVTGVMDTIYTVWPSGPFVLVFTPIAFLPLLYYLLFAVQGSPRSRDVVELQARLNALNRWFKRMGDHPTEAPANGMQRERLLEMGVCFGFVHSVLSWVDEGGQPQAIGSPLANERYWCGEDGRAAQVAALYRSAADYAARHAAENSTFLNGRGHKSASDIVELL